PGSEGGDFVSDPRVLWGVSVERTIAGLARRAGVATVHRELFHGGVQLYGGESVPVEVPQVLLMGCCRKTRESAAGRRAAVHVCRRPRAIACRPLCWVLFGGGRA